jgi:C1A family cysteine protease
VVIIAILIATALASNIHSRFLNFVQTYEKNYVNDEEFLRRMSIFKDNMDIAAKLNAQGGATFGETQFADLTKEEFAEMYLMNTLPVYATQSEQDVMIANPEVPTVASFDWGTKGATTPVKNQGQCGSCWAFSATENIESVYFLAGHPLPVLGPQQIVDCDTADYGCNGGWPYNAYQYIMSAGGQDTEATYPYTAQDGSCKANQPGKIIGAKLSNWKQITSNENQIQSLLTTTSPFSICVDASQWYLYQGGILTANQCGGGVDHCVQLVGFDTSGTPAWKVRNSWGTSWGESGFIRLEMYKGTCVMNQYVTTSIAG